MTEYIKVTYPGQRDVFVDGQFMAETNTIFRIGPGTYVFDLGDPANYVPDAAEQTVSGTTQDDPLEISFEKR